MGRISLPILNIIIGERRAVLVYTIIACGLQAIAWAVKTFIGVSGIFFFTPKLRTSTNRVPSCPARFTYTFVPQSAVATALIGFVISTFYTAAIHTASQLLPRRMHTNAMTLMSSIGQSGSALFPLVIGMHSYRTTIYSLVRCINVSNRFNQYQERHLGSATFCHCLACDYLCLLEFSSEGRTPP